MVQDCMLDKVAIWRFTNINYLVKIYNFSSLYDISVREKTLNAIFDGKLCISFISTRFMVATEVSISRYFCQNLSNVLTKYYQMSYTFGEKSFFALMSLINAHINFTPLLAAIENANTIEERISKIVRNKVFDCHLSPHWRQMAIENTASIDF